MSEANPFIIECRFLFVGPHKRRGRWGRWSGYATEKQRNQALAALRASKPKWIEFRAMENTWQDDSTNKKNPQS